MKPVLKVKRIHTYNIIAKRDILKRGSHNRLEENRWAQLYFVRYFKYAELQPNTTKTPSRTLQLQ